MSTIDDWSRIPYPARRKILDALGAQSVRDAIAAVLDPRDGEQWDLMGPEMSHEEERDLATALAALEGQ